MWLVFVILDSGALDSPKPEESIIVGCIGGLVRSPSDLSQVVPKGKEHYMREEEEYPLWSRPLGVGLNTTPGHGAVELVRMAVHPDFRGKNRTFPVNRSNVHDTNCEVSVSQLLIRTAAEWAVLRNCKYLVLTTGRPMYKAVSAYKRLGFSGNELPENVAFSAEASTLIQMHYKSSKHTL